MKLLRIIYKKIGRIIYSKYAQAYSRLFIERDLRSLPPVPCQLCGGNHYEAYCPRAKELGFLENERTSTPQN